MNLTYDEPTVMWRMRRAALRSHAVIARWEQGARVIWCVNERPVGVREFPDLATAIRWTEQLQFQNWAAGWRPAPDVDPSMHQEN